MGTVPNRPIRRLLIVKLSSIGDIAHALTVVASIRRRQPDLFIGWVVRKRCADILRNNPDIDKLYVVGNKPSFADMQALRSEMRADKYDAAFDMQGLLFSGLVALLSGAPQRYGLDINREFNALFMTDATVPNKLPNQHIVETLAGFQPKIGLQPSVSLDPQDYLIETDALFATELLRGLGKPTVALNVGASTPQKQWPIEHWVELAQWVAAEGGTSIILGGPTDVDSAEKVQQATAWPGRVRNYAGKTTLMQLAAIMAKCDVLVSGDTGPLHVGTLVGVPTVGLYGPTNPRRVGPPPGARSILLTRDLSCSPCDRRPTCNGRFDCMQQLTPDLVMEAIATLLQRPSDVAVPLDVVAS